MIPTQPKKPPLPEDATPAHIEQQTALCNDMASFLLYAIGTFVRENPALDEAGFTTGIGLVIDRMEDLYPVPAILLANRFRRAYANAPETEDYHVVRPVTPERLKMN